MKKLSALVITICLVFSVFSLQPLAVSEPKFDVQEALDSFAFSAETSANGQFGNSDLPEYSHLMMQEFNEGGQYAHYFDGKDTADVPAKDVEAAATKHFTNKTAIINDLRSKEFYNAIDNTYKLSVGGYGTDLPDYIYKGYKALTNDTYEIYALRAYQWGSYGDPYVPAEGEKEGVDYVIYPYTYYDFQDNQTIEHTTVVYGKLEKEAVKTVIKDNNGIYEFDSFEFIDCDSIPELDLNITPDKKISYKTKDVEINGTFDVLDANITFYSEVIDNKDILNLIKKVVVAEDGKFVAYNLSASKFDLNVSNFKGEIEVKIAVPEDYKNPAVFYVSDDGKTVEKFDSKVEDGFIIFKTKHFSNYVVAEQKEENKPDDKQDISQETNKADKTETSPKTSDSRNMYIFGLMLLAAAALSLSGSKIKEC